MNQDKQIDINDLHSMQSLLDFYHKIFLKSDHETTNKVNEIKVLVQ